MNLSRDEILSPADIGDDRYLEQLSGSFNKGVETLNEKMARALQELQGNPTKPELLANYQAALASYTMYRNAQSNVVKAFRDIDQSIVANFK